jgi:hypothetical protein
MAVPSSRIDVLLVPEGLDRTDSDAAVAIAREALIERGVIGPEDAAGPAADFLLRGGFSRLRVDRPGRLTLYANGQGGFRVACPATGGGIAPAFRAAVSAWRSLGAERAVRCPACGGAHPLEALVFSPPAAFGRWAFVFVDAASSSMEGEGRAWLERYLGRARVVVRRV